MIYKDSRYFTTTLTPDERKEVTAFALTSGVQPTWAEAREIAFEFLVTKARAMQKEHPKRYIMESPLMVCKSWAGFYLGTMCMVDYSKDKEMREIGCEKGDFILAPYSRESCGYYATIEEAVIALDGYLNQCAGCLANMPLDDYGNHVYPDQIMACTSHLYGRGEGHGEVINDNPKGNNDA